MNQPRSSRRRYLGFVQDYRTKSLDDSRDRSKPAAPPDSASEPAAAEAKRAGKAKRREYLRRYIAWLWPHRLGIVAFFAIALVAAGLEMLEPLFMRFIIDRVLLNTTLDIPSRVSRLHLTGSAFVADSDSRLPVSSRSSFCRESPASSRR